MITAFSYDLLLSAGQIYHLHLNCYTRVISHVELFPSFYQTSPQIHLFFQQVEDFAVVDSQTSNLPYRRDICHSPAVFRAN